MRQHRGSAIVIGVRECLIVDDNERFLAVAQERLLSGGVDVVGTATSQAEALHPDIILVDISLGSESGFELTRRVVESFPELHGHVVLISTHDEDDFADVIAASPAGGFIPKNRLAARTIFNLLGAGGC